MKACNICMQEKELKEFGTNKASKDGLSYYCFPCRRAKQKLNYRKINGPVVFLTQEEKQQKIKDYRKTYMSKWGSGVYLVSTECGNTYIGSSKNLKHRKDVHNSRKKRADSYIAGYYQVKEFKILEKIENYTRTKGQVREQYWIEKLKPTLNERAAIRYVQDHNRGIVGTAQEIANYYKITTQHLCSAINYGKVFTKGPLANIQLSFI